MTASDRLDVTAMCLTCGTTRRARATRGFGLVRPELTCKHCCAVTTHAAVDPSDSYGKNEDGLRLLCDEVNQLLDELAAMPHVDLRWREMPWCLGHGHFDAPPLAWLADHPGETEFPCICDEHPRLSEGAQPAGWVVEGADEGEWLVELDQRQPRERLGGALTDLRTLLRAGEAEPGYLRPAYSVTPSLHSMRER